MKHLIGIAILFLGVAFAADDANRTRLIGSWETQQGAESRAIWTLAANGDQVRISRTENDRKVSEFECNTGGKECDTKDSGKRIKVSMWFNGPKLVVMETRGTEVVKRRFHATDDGNAMEVELIPIVPQGNTEVVRLSRAAESH